MATININTDGSLLIVSARGNLTSKEIINVVQNLYLIGRVKDVIWDITNASLQLISRSDFEAIAGVVKAAVTNGLRQRGKTAFIENSPDEYDLLCLYTTIAKVNGVPIEYHSYRTIGEARDWISRD